MVNFNSAAWNLFVICTIVTALIRGGFFGSNTLKIEVAETTEVSAMKHYNLFLFDYYSYNMRRKRSSKTADDSNQPFSFVGVSYRPLYVDVKFGDDDDDGVDANNNKKVAATETAPPTTSSKEVH